MSRAVGRAGGVVVAAVLLVGAVGGAYAAGLLGVPAVGGVENRFADVNETTTVIETDITVSNPNPVAVNLGGLGIDYTVWLNDVDLAAGSKQGIDVGTGNSTLAFSTTIANERIPAWWVSHIRNGEHTIMRVEANVTSGLLGRSIEATPVERSIDTDILSSFNSTETRPVNASSPLVSDPILYVNETRASWGDVSTARTPMDMAFVFYNPKPAPYAITKIGYTITMNGVSVGEGETTREHVIAPRSEETIEAMTAIRNANLDAWWVTHLENDQVTELRIEFVATVELPTGQSIEVPLDVLTYTETIETDFFGNDPDGASGEGGSTSANDQDSGGDEATSDRRATTAAPGTDDGTTGDGSSPTPTPTPDDDGGLPLGNDTVTDLP